MQYIISFLEGIITFISPCLLPMLPIYISYFAGGGERETKKTVANAVGFVLGFTVVFIAMGALAGTLGSFFKEYNTVVNIILGCIVIAFGLNYIGLLKINIFNGGKIIRYVCPDCGVIFGPTKFVNQGQKGIDEDYWVHYLGFNEGDSFYKEERAFYMLKPEKDKVYLSDIPAYGFAGFEVR